MTYDIFISYKHKSLATANNLFYRLTTRGYSTFFDLEEMRRDNFDTQLFKYIEEAKDVFVILEKGSLDACKNGNWTEDWFCKEVAYAIEVQKNIIPLLLNGYQMPPQNMLPDELKELVLKNAPEFSFTYFEEFLNKLIDKGYITSEAHRNNKATSVFKFYSNDDCLVYKDGKLVCSLTGKTEEPYYLPVNRKGDYRFKCVNEASSKPIYLKEHIDAEEEKEIDIEWDDQKHLNRHTAITINDNIIIGNEFTVKLGNIKFSMIRVEGGTLEIGATEEQATYSETNEFPKHKITVPTFYIAKFPVTQNIWELVMGYNNSRFKENILQNSHIEHINLCTINDANSIHSKECTQNNIEEKYWDSDKGHYPAETLSYDEAVEFVNRLSKMTSIQFALPTEEEWEYAARGGQNSKHFLYSGSDNIEEVAWYQYNSDGSTHPVGEKKPNELGLYDMCGNVWEWTDTPSHSYLVNLDSAGSCYNRRGGSWYHKPNNCRVARRFASHKSKRTSGLGLRVIIRTSI